MKAIQKTSPDPFTYTVPCGFTDSRNKQPIDVLALHSATPGVIITQAIFDGRVLQNSWAVTHAPSGFRIDSYKYGMQLQKARLLAGALGGLPVDWTATTHEEIARQWSAFMPMDLKQWVREMRGDQ